MTQRVDSGCIHIVYNAKRATLGRALVRNNDTSMMRQRAERLECEDPNPHGLSTPVAVANCKESLVK